MKNKWLLRVDNSFGSLAFYLKREYFQMSLGAGFRSIYDEIRNLRVKSKEGNPSNLQSMPDIHQRQHTIRRTLSKDRSSIWRDNVSQSFFILNVNVVYISKYCVFLEMLLPTTGQWDWAYKKKSCGWEYRVAAFVYLSGWSTPTSAQWT